MRQNEQHSFHLIYLGLILLSMLYLYISRQGSILKGRGGGGGGGGGERSALQTTGHQQVTMNSCIKCWGQDSNLQSHVAIHYLIC